MRLWGLSAPLGMGPNEVLIERLQAYPMTLHTTTLGHECPSLRGDQLLNLIRRQCFWINTNFIDATLHWSITVVLSADT